MLLWLSKLLQLRKDNPKFYKISARNQSGKVDLNELMKKAIYGLKDATGGGHKQSSAATFMKKDLEQFKENLLRSLWNLRK